MNLRRGALVVGICALAFQGSHYLHGQGQRAGDARVQPSEAAIIRLRPSQHVQATPNKPSAVPFLPSTALAPQPVALREARWHERDPDEWQGMRVDLSATPPCYEGFCQGALACIDRQCAPCDLDSQCGDGEICALDHCVLRRLASCRSASECPEGQVCLLTGLTGDHLRENSEMRAVCSGAVVAQPPKAATHSAAEYVGTTNVTSQLNAAIDAANAKRP